MEKKKIKNSLVEGPITPEKIGTSIAHHQVKTNIGAHDIFLGQVRADEIEGKTPFIRKVEMSIDDAHKVANMLIVKQSKIELSGNAINASVDNFFGQSTVLTIVYDNGNSGTRSLICNFSDFHKLAIQAVEEFYKKK